MAGDAEAIAVAADRILEAHRDARRCAPVRDLIGTSDVDAAYAVQERNTRRWLAAGRRLVGRKIGLTARSVQRQLGVAQPDYGMLYADMASADGEPIPMDGLLQPRVEGEIAFVLGRDLADPQPTLIDVLAAIEFVLPAVEVVDSRYRDFRFSLTDVVADNTSSAAFVIGARYEPGIDVSNLVMLLEIDGVARKIGSSAAIPGHPAYSLAAAARIAAERGETLRASDIVMTGAGDRGRAARGGSARTGERRAPRVRVIPGDGMSARTAARAAFTRRLADVAKDLAFPMMDQPIHVGPRLADPRLRGRVLVGSAVREARMSEERGDFRAYFWWRWGE